MKGARQGMTEADTCRMYVVPKLHTAGWTDDQIVEQKYFTDGRIIATDKRHFREAWEEGGLYSPLHA